MNITHFSTAVLQSEVTNKAWSWGSTDTKRKRVYLRVWAEEVEGAPGKESVRVYMKNRTSESLGHPERKRHIALIEVDRHDGYAILCNHAERREGRNNKITHFESRFLRRIGGFFTDELGNTHARLQERVTLPELGFEQVVSKAAKDPEESGRLPAAMLETTTADQIWEAIESLRSGEAVHAFGESTDYDVLLEDGTRLPPKAILGIAATAALGFTLQPKHFSGGESSACFRILRASGLTIVKKGEMSAPAAVAEVDADIPENMEWEEGKKVLRQHYRRERRSGLSQAKKASFKKQHGRLFCELCNMNPVVTYGGFVGEACIEVHHHSTEVHKMEEGHMTKLGDLMCLCANCHRVEHRKLKA